MHGSRVESQDFFIWGSWSQYPNADGILVEPPPLESPTKDGSFGSGGLKIWELGLLRLECISQPKATFSCMISVTSFKRDVSLTFQGQVLKKNLYLFILFYFCSLERIHKRWNDSVTFKVHFSYLIPTF